MLCPNCGKELPEGSGICDACGSTVNHGQAFPPDSEKSSAVTGLFPGDSGQSPEDAGEPSGGTARDIYADYSREDTGPDPAKPRKKRLLALKITAVILAVVVLAAGIAAAGYFTFLPARITLKVAQYFTLQKTWRHIDQAMARNRQKVDILYDTPLRSDTRINLFLDSASLESMGLSEQMAEFVAGLLKDITIQASSEVDMANRKQNLGISLNYLGNPTLSLDCFFDNDRVGIFLPELSQKAISGRFSDLPRLSEMYPGDLKDLDPYLESFSGLDPWLASTISREVTVDSKDIKKLMETYGMLLVNNVDGRKMSIKRGRTTEVFGEEIRCMEVTVALDRNDQLKLLTTLLDTMAEDDTLYDVVFKNAEKVLNIMIQGTPAITRNMGAGDLDISLGKPQVRLLLSGAKYLLRSDMFPEKAEIKAYIKGLDVVKYELGIPSGTSGDGFRITFENLVDDNGARTGFGMDLTDAGSSFAASLAMYRKYDVNSDIQDLDIEFGFTTAEDSIRMVFSSIQDPDGPDTVKGKIDLNIDYALGDDSGGLDMTADIVQERNRDGLPENIDLTASFFLDIPFAFTEPVNLSLAAESDIRYNVDVRTPGWAENAIDIGSAPKEEVDSFVNDVMQTIDSIMELAKYLY